ncbi:MAG: ABC transporter substrate-binding protein [Streptosporangiaceae bacterium]
MPRARSLAVVMCGLALAATACGSSAKSPAATSNLNTGGTLTELISSDPGNLNPLQTVNGTTRSVDFYSYDPLINQIASGQLVSGLASKWQQAGNTYTFTLRRGVTCSDGSALTASTVAANVSYIANPANKSPLLGLFVPPGAKATADDAASTVTITLAGPFPFFLNDLASFGIVCAKGLADPAILAQGTDGTGPFTLTGSVPGEQYTFAVRRGYHWGPAGASTDVAGMPGTIVLKVVTNMTTAANLLLDGQANAAGSVTGPDTKRLAAAHLFKAGGTLVPLGELWFNQAAGHPGASETVRQALLMALNLPQVGTVLTQGQGVPAAGLVTVTPKACSGNTVAGNLPTYDPAKARTLLDQAGWTAGPGGIRAKAGKQLAISILYPTDVGGDPASAFELAAQEWGNIGVKVTLQSNTSTGEEGVLFGPGTYDVVDIALGVTVPSEAVPFLSGPVPPAGTNFAHIDNSAYNTLVAQAAAKRGATGCPQWNQAEVDLFKAADIAPFENEAVPAWGKSATFQVLAGLIVPTSLRLYKG